MLRVYNIANKTIIKKIIIQFKKNIYINIKCNNQTLPFNLNVLYVGKH